MPKPACRGWCGIAILLVLQSICPAQHVPEGKLTVIPQGTSVQLQTLQTISSADAKKGDLLDFVVVKDVTVGGSTLIRAGTIARGSVVAVKGKRLLGIGGRITISLETVELVSGETIALRARKEFKGNSHSKIMLAGFVAAGLVYLPAAPTLVLTRGEDSTVLKGTEITGFLDGGSTASSQEVLTAGNGASELNQMLRFLPGRVLDADGHQGDMLNLIFVGDRIDLERAFHRAGWIPTDKSKAAVFWRLLQHGTRYAKLPMATLYVFGRPQTYSFAIPDPTGMLTRRHHLRIWRTHYNVNGTPIWVGAATHDVAIQIDIRKLRITHRIDARVDAERDFIGDNLAETQLLVHEGYLQCLDPVFTGETATGERYYSDSRLLFVELRNKNTETLGVPEHSSVPEKRDVSNPGALTAETVDSAQAARPSLCSFCQPR
jgi:hypothetical protein